MDPLSVLSLAAIVAQFLELGCKLVARTKEVGERGSPVSITHLSRTSADLVMITENLERQFKIGKETETERSQYDKEEKALRDLGYECHCAAKEFVACLNRLAATPINRWRKWRDVRSALSSMWNEDKIEKFALRLNEYRHQLSLRVLFLLNSRSLLQSDQLARLQRSNQEVIEVLSLTSGLVSNRLEQNLKAQHAETIAAILTLRDGTSQTITRSQPLHAHFAVQTGTTYSKDLERGTLSEGEAGFKTQKTTSISRQVLDALHFRTIADRRQIIHEAHGRTFEWIFEKPSDLEKPWDDFGEWLSRGTGCYWINGKAGSGKSTLMKFVEDHLKTMDLLHAWAESDKFILGSFYFWYAGTTIQKSQIGLLRSILLTILEQNPDLIPHLFPNLCRSILSNSTFTTLDLSLIELKQAFIKFFSDVPDGLKVCLIIDGVDEYDGEPIEICNLLAEAGKSPNVKVLVSSRPIPSCVHAFSGNPKLRLQDLTRNDLRRYSEDILESEPLMIKLERVEPGATSKLIEGIAEKASGVFLWVIVVVRRLLRGLEEYDTLQDLMSSLDELPPDLQELYEFMLSAMSLQHRQQGSRLLQLVLLSTETQGRYQMSTAQLSFAEEDDYTAVVKHPIEAMSREQLAWRVELTEGRIRSRCCGLLELADASSSNPTTDRTNSCITFLHRTVVEFLNTTSIWNRIISLTEGTSFDATKALLISCLWEIKARPPVDDGAESFSPAVCGMYRMLEYTRNLQDAPSVFQGLCCEEMCDTMSRYWHDRELFVSADAEFAAMKESTKLWLKHFNIEYPEDILLRLISVCPPAHLESIVRSIRNMEMPIHLLLVKTRYPELLMTQYLHETSPRVRLRFSRNLEYTLSLVNGLEYADPRLRILLDLALLYTDTLAHSDKQQIQFFLDEGLLTSLLKILKVLEFRPNHSKKLALRGLKVHSRMLNYSEELALLERKGFSFSHDASIGEILRRLKVRVCEVGAVNAIRKSRRGLRYQTQVVHEEFAKTRPTECELFDRLGC